MIPILKPNEKFFVGLEDDVAKWYTEKSEPIAFFNNIPIYRNDVDTDVKKDCLFDEYITASIDTFGYCPSEDALIKILEPFQKDNKKKYLVTAFWVDKYVADCDDSYRYLYNENGEDMRMNYPDYVDEYGHPTTELKNKIISFDIYQLMEY